MTEKEKMIDTIYEVIADKTLSFGCKIIITTSEKYGVIYNIKPHYDYVTRIDGKMFYGLSFKYGYKREDGTFEGGWRWDGIIGHPVMIGDVLDWIQNNKNYMLISYKINKKQNYTECGFDLPRFGIIIEWKEKRKPIEDQSEECIRFIYNLCN